MYKRDLALNNLQELVCRKTQPVNVVFFMIAFFFRRKWVFLSIHFSKPSGHIGALDLLPWEMKPETEVIFWTKLFVLYFALIPPREWHESLSIPLQLWVKRVDWVL